MRTPLVAGLAAGFALSLGTGAAFAGAVYVPVPDPINATGSTHALQVWVTNAGTAQGPYTATFLTAETDGTQRPSPAPTPTPVPAGRTSLLGGVSTPGKIGLLEVNASSAMAIEARLYSTAPNGQTTSVSPVPVISSENLFAAGKTAVLLGLRRDLTRGDYSNLGVVNLGSQAAQCQIKLFRADGSQIAATATLTFKPLSLRPFGDAFGLLGEQQAADGRAEVSCDQPFYAYATIFTQSSSEMLFVLPAASGASTLTGAGGGQGPPPSTDGSILFSAAGLFHTPAPGNDKKTFTIPVTHDLSLRKMIIDMDFVPGPWNRAKIPGNHAVLWLYRGKFRSNTIANVNAFSPPKLSLKASQNVNLPPHNDTQDEQGVAWVQGQRYHLQYTYDAEHGMVTAVLSSGGTTLKTLQLAATAPSGVLDISTADGLTAEFGHYANQSGPEVASYGWQYLNLQIRVMPY
ncbi:MAG TPA: hypothetical protein VGH73_04645 [Thermoanaerobaculia bacterium]|jgi:hypothetical protein